MLTNLLALCGVSLLIGIFGYFILSRIGVIPPDSSAKEIAEIYRVNGANRRTFYRLVTQMQLNAKFSLMAAYPHSIRWAEVFESELYTHKDVRRLINEQVPKIEKSIMELISEYSAEKAVRDAAKDYWHTILRPKYSYQKQLHYNK